MMFNARQDRHLIRPTHRSNRFVLVEVTAPAARSERGRPPVNLAFILDRSGSMSGDKIRLAKQAIVEAIGRLHDDDRFAIVVYDDRVDVVVPGTHATPDTRRTALDRLREIDARGSTNLGEGWLRGAQQVAEALADEGVNRCLLLTDGLANVGITDRDALARHAGELRARGVSTTTFGVGEDFDEVLLQAMASAGGGHFYFIASAASIRDHITGEVGETLEVVARGVTLVVSAAEGIRVESLSPHPVNAGRDRTEVVLGDLASDERVEAVLRLNFPYGEAGRSTGAVFALADRDGVVTGDAKLGWAYADDHANNQQERDRVVDRAVARIFAARARQEAVGRNRHGDYDGARHVVEATARRIRGYAGRDPELRAILGELEGQLQEFATPMMEMSRKSMYAQSAYVLNSRMADGMAIRDPDRGDR
ncbi:MAG TPA: VWA domain-containing protein [Patescibacteria group bacterium]|nr:VWA domain-containing protein [Patescibacteria group bacterium]